MSQLLDGRFIPTIAFYSPNALGAITKALHSDNYSFKNVYHELSTDYLDVRDVMRLILVQI